MVIRNIIEQHAEEAAFLWLLREAAITAPHYTLQDIANLDERIEAHVDGLRLAGDTGWEVCEQALALKEPGEVFTAAVLAFESGSKKRIENTIAVGEKSSKCFKGLIAALAWIDIQQAAPIISTLVKSTNTIYRRLGISACASHRSDPGSVLQSSLDDDDALLRARSLRMVGELKRTDLLPQLKAHFEDDDDLCQFWAIWSASLLGEASAVQLLLPFVKMDSPYKIRVFQVALRLMNNEESQFWLKELAQQQDLLRYVLMGAGICGDPIYVPTLLKQLETPEVARVAGEALNLITGLEIEAMKFDAEMPVGFEGGPTEDPDDDNVAMDPDEDLPWPDASLIQQWWSKEQSHFQPGARYLLGTPISQHHCIEVLQKGTQRQRIAAAFEIALMQASTPLFQFKAAARRQQKLLQL